MKGQVYIEEMYAFVVMDDDGTEGIPAFLAASGVMMPMVGADMNRVASLRPMAEDIVKNLKKDVSLVKFTNRELVEVIGVERSKDG